MNFEFATAARIIFGRGKFADVGQVTRSFGDSVLVVTGSSIKRAQPLLNLLEAEGLNKTLFSIKGEPTVQEVRSGVERARAGRCEGVIGFGGGSAIDCAKAIAAMLANPDDVLDYLEVIGQGRKIEYRSVPFIAIPTTAGAGAEVTKNAVLASPEHKVKASLRSPLMLARVALVDPELTTMLPPATTAATGLDALTQLIEPFTCCRTNPLVDSLCREAIPRVVHSIRRACEQGDDLDAREDMAMASLFGGLALANAGLGAVHGFAAPIGGRFPAPHGAVCAALLPHVMETNLRALRQRYEESETIGRYEEIARLLTGNALAKPEDGVAWVTQLVKDLQIPGLATYGLLPTDIPELVQHAAKASSMKANPLPLTEAELTAILERAL